MHRILMHSRRAAAIAACALVALGLAGATSAQAKCSAIFVELPVKMVGSRPIATVAINGTPVTLLVDTGAF